MPCTHIFIVTYIYINIYRYPESYIVTCVYMHIEYNVVKSCQKKKTLPTTNDQECHWFQIAAHGCNNGQHLQVVEMIRKSGRKKGDGNAASRL